MRSLHAYLSSTADKQLNSALSNQKQRSFMGSTGQKFYYSQKYQAKPVHVWIITGSFFVH